MSVHSAIKFKISLQCALRLEAKETAGSAPATVPAVTTGIPPQLKSHSALLAGLVPAQKVLLATAPLLFARRARVTRTVAVELKPARLARQERPRCRGRLSASPETVLPRDLAAVKALLSRARAQRV